MTSPPERVEIVCERCGARFEAWLRRSINLTLGEEWTEEEITDATTARCPACGNGVQFRTLVVDGDTVGEGLG